MRVSSFSAIVATAFLVAAAAGDTAPDAMDRIVARLGSDTFRDRETATRELDALGAAALDALRRAAGSTDPETRRRAADLIERINRAPGRRPHVGRHFNRIRLQEQAT